MVCLVLQGIAVLFPDTLYPMGWAPPLGSLLSALLCAGFFLGMKKTEKWNGSSSGLKKSALVCIMV